MHSKAAMNKKYWNSRKYKTADMEEENEPNDIVVLGIDKVFFCL